MVFAFEQHTIKYLLHQRQNEVSISFFLHCLENNEFSEKEVRKEHDFLSPTSLKTIATSDNHRACEKVPCKLSINQAKQSNYNRIGGVLLLSLFPLTLTLF